ncbi:MAG TPA: hypothetical protein VMH34_05335 [Gammaproteobacteria bacterium]|nr:hypothetical protein [Gammaproteobacteria bacterium]
MNIRPLITLVFSLLAGMGSYGASAYDTNGADEFSHLTLRGIQTIALDFNGFYGDVQRCGVSEDSLRSEIERRLVQAGLKLIPRDQIAQTPQAALLLVDLHVDYASYYYYSYSVALKLKQKIPLADPQSYTSETVWTRGNNGIAEFSRLCKIYDETRALVDVFVAEHAAQNAAPR